MIYLLRHGEIEGSEIRRYIGHTDANLSSKGIKQAEYWKDRLSDIQFDSIYTSDLTRTRQTAELVRGERKSEIIQSDKLREINMGTWDGKTVSDIKAGYPEEWAKRGDLLATYRTPEGESFLDVEKRVMPYFERITRQISSNILVITHAGVIRVILSLILKKKLKDLFRLKMGYGALTILNKHNNKLSLEKEAELPTI